MSANRREELNYTVEEKRSQFYKQTRQRQLQRTFQAVRSQFLKQHQIDYHNRAIARIQNSQKLMEKQYQQGEEANQRNKPSTQFYDQNLSKNAKIVNLNIAPVTNYNYQCQNGINQSPMFPNPSHSHANPEVNFYQKEKPQKWNVPIPKDYIQMNNHMQKPVSPIKKKVDPMAQYKDKTVYVKFNNYVVFTEKLGSGTYSTVYLGANTLTGQKVAVKQLMQLEKNEIACLRKVSSPYVTKLLDVWNKQNSISSNQTYLVLEHCVKNFRQEIKTNCDRYCHLKYFDHVIKGMDALFKEKMIHRDLKFENILISQDGVAKITDFGLAKSLGDMSNVFSAKCGTPYTMAPEIFFNGGYTKTQYSQKSDIWSLGVMLHEILYNSHPFAYKEENMKRMRRVKINRRFGYLDELIDRSLVSHPERRISWKDFMKIYESKGISSSFYCVANILPPLEEVDEQKPKNKKLSLLEHQKIDPSLNFQMDIQQEFPQQNKQQQPESKWNGRYDKIVEVPELNFKKKPKLQIRKPEDQKFKERLRGAWNGRNLAISPKHSPRNVDEAVKIINLPQRDHEAKPPNKQNKKISPKQQQVPQLQKQGPNPEDFLQRNIIRKYKEFNNNNSKQKISKQSQEVNRFNQNYLPVQQLSPPQSTTVLNESSSLKNKSGTGLFSPLLFGFAAMAILMISLI